MLLNLRLAPAQGLQDTRVVLQGRAQVRVLVPGAAGEVEDDARHSPAQRLGLSQAVGVLEQQRQVVQVDGDVGVLGSVGRFVDDKSTAHQRLGLSQTVGGLKQQREVVQGLGDVGVVCAQALREDTDHTAIKWLGLGQAG